MIHIDSSFLIRSLIPGTDEDRVLQRWMDDGEHVGISVVAWAEFLCGPATAEASALVMPLIDEPEPLDAAAASASAHLFNETGRRRGSLPDCMIAAIAIQAGARLATSDLKDFQRFESLGLRVVGPG